MVTCPSTNPSICQRERKSSVGSSVSIAKQKISLMLWFEWKLNWWNHFPMNDISVCMLFCLLFFVPPTFLHVAALNFDCARLCVTWCVRFPQTMSCVPHFAQIASIKFCVFLYHCVPTQSSINTACFWFSSLLCVLFVYLCVPLHSTIKAACHCFY